MTLEQFEFTSELPAPADVAYAWHERPGALERLLPPWDRTRVRLREGDLGSGRVVLDVPIGPLTTRWVARHVGAEPGRRFVDEQAEGPFARWRHEHIFEPLGADRCRLVDRIGFALPGGAVGALAAPAVRHRLTRTFRYRHATLAADLALQQRFARLPSASVVVSGATGLLGGVLVPLLTTAGHRVRRLVRRDPARDDIAWSPARGELDAAALEGTDLVVHLAGESIAGGRWTEERRRRILESRTLSTTLLADTLAALRRPPGALVSASAVGIYGDRGDELLTEETPLEGGPDTMFVERVGHAWEAATAPAERAGIRVVRTRVGIVLTPAGGALGTMLPAFRAGLGGRIGSGRQYMSWIGVDDVAGAWYHALFTPALRGPVNLTAPEPVRNAEFARVLGEVLGRPAILPVPAPALRLALGELADELLLSSARVLPQRLRESGYGFRHADLAAALGHVLGR